MSGSESVKVAKMRKLREEGEIPLLYFDVRTRESNLESVKRHLEIFCRKNYYHLRNCLELEELPILNPPDRNTIITRAMRTEGNNTRRRGATSTDGESTGDQTSSTVDMEYVKIILSEEYRQFKRDETERNKELSKLFGVIIGILDLGLHQKVITNPDFAAIKASDNGFRLWKLVCRVITTGGGVETPAMKEERIVNRYQYMRMRNNETLSEYHERFREATKNFTDNGMQAPSDARQAVRFIQG